jgi:hypothetical protein
MNFERAAVSPDNANRHKDFTEHNIIFPLYAAEAFFEPATDAMHAVLNKVLRPVPVHIK